MAYGPNFEVHLVLQAEAVASLGCDYFPTSGDALKGTATACDG